MGGGLFRGLFVAMLGGVMVLSLYPRLATPDVPAGSDKLAHFLMYFALAVPAALGWPARARLVALALPLLGFGIELAQIPIPGRGFEWADALANGLGAACGAVLASAAIRLARR